MSIFDLPEATSPEDAGRRQSNRERYLPQDAAGRWTGESIPCLQLPLVDEGNIWAVTEPVVAYAAAFKQRIAPLAGQVIDPPQQDEQCFAPRFYPELFVLQERQRPAHPPGIAVLDIARFTVS